MPYISAKEVKEKRMKIRREFPDFKFSITCQNHSSISLSILEAPFNMLIDGDRKYESVNHFYIEKHYKKYPRIKEILLKIKQILTHNQHEIVYDGDYGSVPNFYINMSIGSWKKPFKVVRK